MDSSTVALVLSILSIIATILAVVFRQTGNVKGEQIVQDIEPVIADLVRKHAERQAAEKAAVTVVPADEQQQ